MEIDSDDSFGDSTLYTNSLGSTFRRSDRLKSKMASLSLYEGHPAADPPPKDLITEQPMELLMKIMEYLSPQDLARVARVCKTLHTLANEEYLWKRHCNALWTNAHWIGLFGRADYSHLVGQIEGDFTTLGYPAPPNDNSMLNPTEMLTILRNRGRDTGRWIVEDGELIQGSLQELQNAVISTIPEGVDRVNKSMSGFRALMNGMASWKSRPQPCFSSKYKTAYFTSFKDLDRNVITQEELISHEWSYHASGWTDFQNITTQDPLVRFYPPTANDGIGIRALSSPDFSYPRPRTWSLDSRGRLQVGQFPRHDVQRQRLNKWGWEMSNGWVTYKSQGVAPVRMGPETEKIFARANEAEAFFW